MDETSGSVDIDALDHSGALPLDASLASVSMAEASMASLGTVVEDEEAAPPQSAEPAGQPESPPPPPAPSASLEQQTEVVTDAILGQLVQEAFADLPSLGATAAAAAAAAA
eukprot:COSAG02_NODE_35126_length_473_cov_0.978610_1_plen_110_part_01